MPYSTTEWKTISFTLQHADTEEAKKTGKCFMISKEPTDVDTPSKDDQLKCRVCGRKTLFKCNKCLLAVEPILLCSRAIKDRVCWENFHAHRTYDVQSNQS